VLLLRLRQICSHPSLIQEGRAAFVAPEEVDDDFKPELSTDLTRARRLVSPEFVTKMKQKFKEAVLERIKAEKEVCSAMYILFLLEFMVFFASSLLMQP
jgi:SNF2 family DNA or RNA helicase